MRAVKVNLRSLGEVPEMLEFYMGRNTPERKEYIIENLI
jgi:topoisomerase-4 subunit B